MLLLCCAFVWWLQNSHLGLGLAWRGVREDEIAARSSGVNAPAYKALAFSLGAPVAGLSGSLLVHQYRYISPDVFDFQTSLLVLTIVVLGGMSSVPGTVLGAIVLVGLPEVFRPLVEMRVSGVWTGALAAGPVPAPGV